MCCVPKSLQQASCERDHDGSGALGEVLFLKLLAVVVGKPLNLIWVWIGEKNLGI
jgi:hypothetical protein